MNTQPEALRIAHELLKWSYTTTDVEVAAAELRRLHEVNAELLKVCKSVVTNGIGSSDIAAMRAAIAKAEGGAA